MLSGVGFLILLDYNLFLFFLETNILTVIQGLTGDYCFDNLALTRWNDFLKHSDKVFSKVLNAIDGLLAEDQSILFKLSLKIAIVFSFILRLYLA